MFREEISQKRLNRVRGIDNHERLDEELYQDFETDDARKVYARSFLLWCPAVDADVQSEIVAACRNALLKRPKSLKSWRKPSLRQVSQSEATQMDLQLFAQWHWSPCWHG